MSLRPCVEECKALTFNAAADGKIDCYYDADMAKILGDFNNHEGSIKQAGTADKHTEAERLVGSGFINGPHFG